MAVRPVACLARWESIEVDTSGVTLFVTCICKSGVRMREMGSGPSNPRLATGCYYVVAMNTSQIITCAMDSME